MSIVQQPDSGARGTTPPLFHRHADGHTVALMVIQGTAPDIDEDSYRAALGEFLFGIRRRLRVDGRRLTQAQAAELIGTDTDTLGRWERGSVPRPHMFAKIAAGYRIPERSWRYFITPPPNGAVPADLWDPEDWDEQVAERAGRVVARAAQRARREPRPGEPSTRERRAQGAA